MYLLIFKMRNSCLSVNTRSNGIVLQTPILDDDDEAEMKF